MISAARFELMENCDVVFSNVTSGLTAMDQLREKIDPSINDKPEVTFKDIPILANAFERYRWPTTMALQGMSQFYSQPRKFHPLKIYSSFYTLFTPCLTF